MDRKFKILIEAGNTVLEIEEIDDCGDKFKATVRADDGRFNTAEITGKQMIKMVLDTLLTE